jgi:hypothetical protein
MQLYRFGAWGGTNVATREQWIARELSRKESVCLTDADKNTVVARLRSAMARNVEEGREEVDRLVQVILKTHAQQDA